MCEVTNVLLLKWWDHSRRDHCNAVEMVVTGSMGISLFNSSPNKSSCVRSRLCNAKKKIFNCQMTVKTLLIVSNSYSYFCLSKFYYL
jgi:hypothetical protein